MQVAPAPTLTYQSKYLKASYGNRSTLQNAEDTDGGTVLASGPTDDSSDNVTAARTRSGWDTGRQHSSKFSIKLCYTDSIQGIMTTAGGLGRWVGGGVGTSQQTTKTQCGQRWKAGVLKDILLP